MSEPEVDRMSDIEHRIERAIQEGEEVLIGQLGKPPDEEAWADLAGMVIGDLADDYEGAVDLIRELDEMLRPMPPFNPVKVKVREWIETPSRHRRGSVRRAA